MSNSDREIIARTTVMMWASLYMGTFLVLVLVMLTYLRSPLLALATLVMMAAIPKLFRPQIVRFLRWDLYR